MLGRERPSPSNAQIAKGPHICTFLSLSDSQAFSANRDVREYFPPPPPPLIDYESEILSLVLVCLL